MIWDKNILEKVDHYRFKTKLALFIFVSIKDALIVTFH